MQALLAKVKLPLNFCGLLHHWTKWGRVLAHLDRQGTIFEGMYHYQQRSCTNCGAIQRRNVEV